MPGWENIVGHKQLVEHLRHIALEENPGHAYLLVGEKGAGKKSIARIFAQALQCTAQEGRPCGVCRDCRQAADGNHPDIITISHEKPASISVDDLRTQLVEDIQIRPYSGKHKIYLIPDAEKMTVQAQNAILKTLEEPPSYAVILLMTVNEQALLETVRSRCIMLGVRSVPDEQIRSYLMDELKLPDYQADLFTAFAQGSLGKAIRLASSEDFQAVKNAAVHLVRNAPSLEMPEIIEEVKSVQEYKISVSDYLDLIALWVRDMILFKATRNPDGLVMKDQLQNIRETSRLCSYEGAEEILSAIETAKERLDANVNFDLTMELLFLTIKENIHD